MASRLDLAIVVLSLLFEKLGSLPIPLSDPGERRRECLQKIAPLQPFWPRLRFDHRFGSRPFRPAAFRTFKHFHVRKFLDVAQAILKLAMAACRRHEAVWAGPHLSSPLVRAALPARIPGGPANPLGGRKVDWGHSFMTVSMSPRRTEWLKRGLVRLAAQGL